MINVINWIVKGLVTITIGTIILFGLLLLALLFRNDEFVFIANNMMKEIWK